jgi:hypothetical protein
LSPARDRLFRADLVTRKRHTQLWDTLVDARARIAALGLDVAAVKGVTAEARWYRRMGERPCSDVDLLLAPDAAPHARAVLDALQPGQELRDDIRELVRTGVVQSVNAELDGVPIDLHFDLLKLGIPTRQPDLVWTRTQPFALPDGSTVRVPDPELSLVHFLLHLNKDSFAWLLGFADVARIAGDESLDWDFVDRFVREEGIEVMASCSLAAVIDVARVTQREITRPEGVRTWAWRAVWPERAQLRGSAGANRSRRQDVIPFLARGRHRDALRWLARTLLPPRETVARQYEDLRGPYAWRLTKGRLRTAWRRRAAFRARDERIGAAERAPELAAPHVTARLLREAAETRPFWVDVYGRSMGWSIPGGCRVRVEPGVRPRRGEVWAYCDDRGNVVVHRSRGERAGAFRFQGDARVRADPPVCSDQLIGRVVELAPARNRWRWSAQAGALQRTPRMAVAVVVRAGRAARSAR